MFHDFSGIIKQFGNHVARIAVVFMIFSTGMFISAAGEYKCCYIFSSNNYKSVWFKRLLIKAYILTSTLQIDGNN